MIISYSASLSNAVHRLQLLSSRSRIRSAGSREGRSVCDLFFLDRLSSVVFSTFLSVSPVCAHVQQFKLLDRSVCIRISRRVTRPIYLTGHHHQAAGADPRRQAGRKAEENDERASTRTGKFPFVDFVLIPEFLTLVFPYFFFRQSTI